MGLRPPSRLFLHTPALVEAGVVVVLTLRKYAVIDFCLVPADRPIPDGLESPRPVTKAPEYSPGRAKDGSGLPNASEVPGGSFGFRA